MLTALTLTFHFQIEALLGIKQQKLYRIPYGSTNTKLEGYKHLYLHGLLQHPHIHSISMLFGCVNGTDIYTVKLQFITTSVVIIYKHADI